MGKQKKENRKPTSRASVLKRAKRNAANYKVLANLEKEV